MDLFKLLNIFVQIGKYICLRYKIYLFNQMKCICSNQEIYLRRVRFVLRQVNMWPCDPNQWRRRFILRNYNNRTGDRFRLLYKKATKDKSHLRFWLQDNRLCIRGNMTPSPVLQIWFSFYEIWRDVSQYWLLPLKPEWCACFDLWNLSVCSPRDCLLPESHLWSHLSHLKKLKRRRRLIRFPGCGCAQALGETERAPPSARTQPSQRRARSTGIQSII